jgi:RNA polymerase-binding transcription factor
MDDPRPLGEVAAELAATEAEVADVEAALGRIDAGDYGTCEVCGAALADTQLESSPAARACAEHR